MSPTLKNFAVIGAGTVGLPLAKDLLAEGGNVFVFTRPESSSKKDLPPSAKSVSVSLTDATALAAAFKTNQIDVVLSTVGFAALEGQTIVADAAKEAGVKLFVPSEYGFSTLGFREGPMAVKQKVADYSASIGLPYARIFTGAFIQFLPWLTGADSGTFTILGKGEAKGTFTNLGDITAYVAYIVTHLPLSELSNKIFRIQGELASLNQVASYYGSKVTVKYVDEIPGEPIVTFLCQLLDAGKATSGYDHGAGAELTGAEAAGADNGLWKGHQWKSIKETLAL